MKSDYKKIILLDNIASYLDITSKNLVKLFKSCSLMKMEYYSIAHLQFLVDNLSPSNIKEVILIKKLEEFIIDFKEKNI